MDRSDAEEVNRYGPHGKLVLDPQAGQCLEAKQRGRYGLLIHGGLPAPGQKLRPTYGCARVFDADMARLAELHRREPVVRCLVDEVDTGLPDPL